MRGLRALLAAGMVLAAGLMPSALLAQDYPNRLVRIVIAYPPGHGVDIFGRYIVEKLKPLMGQAVIVENRAGASGMVGAEYGAHAKADGYTLLIQSSVAFANLMYLLKEPRLDATKAIQMVAMINRQPLLFVVEAKSPLSSIADLTAHIKARQGRATYGWATTLSKVIGELYAAKSGAALREVNYRSGPDVLNDLLGGALDFGIVGPVVAIPGARDGRLRILASASGTRFQALPEVPTLQESGIDGVALDAWLGLMAPAGTPRDIVDRLNQWTNTILRQDDTRAFLEKIGSAPWITTVDEAQKIYLDELRDWKTYVTLARMTPQ